MKNSKIRNMLLDMIEELRKENKQLKAENRKLKAENQSMEICIIQLEGQNDRLSFDARYPHRLFTKRSDSRAANP